MHVHICWKLFVHVNVYVYAFKSWADLSKKKERDREEEIPELRVSLQLKNRGVSVPLQGPGGGGRGCHAGDRREKTCKINLSRNNTIIHTNRNIIAHTPSNNTLHASQENSEKGPIKSAHMGMQFDTMLKRFMHHVYALFKGWHVCYCGRCIILKICENRMRKMTSHQIFLRI